MSHYFNDSVFWIDVDKIRPNPFQPRKEFDQTQLESLADSIRQYGVLQALVVTRKEVEKQDGGLAVEYELVAGERRLRAAKLAGVAQVPVLIRTGDDTDQAKLELAIIENLQREDLNPVDRARAFERLVKEFGFKHGEIAKKIGKSREYVSNTVRLLLLPKEILDALAAGKIAEGHTRPLLMLIDRPEEQDTLFKEILLRRVTVREAEMIARKIAFEKVRRPDYVFDPELVELEEKIATSLGTRVSIERKKDGGRLSIEFFSNDDLRAILSLINSNKQRSSDELLRKHISKKAEKDKEKRGAGREESSFAQDNVNSMSLADTPELALDDRTKKEKVEGEDDLYSATNFSI